MLTSDAFVQNAPALCIACNKGDAEGAKSAPECRDLITTALYVLMLRALCAAIDAILQQ